MGWILSTASRLRRSGVALLLTAGLLYSASGARAQIGTGADLYQDITNQFLLLAVGSGTNVAGSIFLQTVPGNPNNPTAGSAVTLLFGGPVEAPNATAVKTGTVVYVRVDGGRSAGGNDYVFGRQTEGTWLSAPTVVGNHIEARWQTLPQTVNTATIDPRIEVDLVASFVHDQARFQFTIKNNSPGQTHTVGLAFLQDIVAGKQDEELGGPLRLPNGPYLRTETLLQGAQVPAYWDVFVLGQVPTSTNIPGGSSIRGILKPLNSTQNINFDLSDPTPPSRFALGDLNKLSGLGNPITNPLFMGRDFNWIWNFQPDPSLNLNSGTIDNAVIDYWDPVAVAAGQSVRRVTYVGQSTSDFAFTQTAALAVTGTAALGLTTTKDANGNPTACVVSPSTFSITASVQNQTDLTGSGTTISPITVFLDLPKGLALATGETNPKTILTSAAGSENSVTWQVTPDAANSVSGRLQYTVTATPNIGVAMTVQRTIDVPGPAVYNLLGTTATQGLYSMASFPLNFGNTPPSTVFGLNANQPAPDFDLVRFNPTAGHYEPVNTLLPGYAYWLRSRLPANKTIVIDCLKYPPLTGQVQPAATSYKVAYPKGWNQIGNPDIYRVRFSEIQVFDQASQTSVNAVTAADPQHRWIQPAVFFYDTSDPNPQNWHYVLEDNFGFDMVPYQGYWILALRDGLQFIYPGVDVPGASVTRAALVGVGMGTGRSRAAASDWLLQIRAKGSVSTDYTTTIGVNSAATDKQDYYKISKPPVQENQLSLDIVHTDWSGGGRYAKDLRSAAATQKSWQMVLSSTKANEPVTFSWPGLATSVPKSYRLTLIDTDSNSRYDMRSTSSVVLTTNANKTRNVQIIAEPTRGSGPALITSFDVNPVAGGPGRAVSSVSINYTLSQRADTHITIRTGSGRVLRTLVGQPVTGSTSSGRAVFDLRDSQGRLISTGVYQAELTAQGADGQISRQIRPLVLAR